MHAGQLQRNHTRGNHIIEYFSLEQRISDAQQLQPFLAGGVRQQVAQAVAAIGGDLTGLQQMVASLVEGLPAMLSK